MATSEKERTRLDRSGLQRPAFEGGFGPAPSLRRQVGVASGLNVLLGIWLICAPFVLTYSDIRNALWNDVVFGAVITTLAGARVLGAYRQARLSWTNAVLGCWLVIAPFALSYSHVTDAVSNDIVVGLIVLTFASWSASLGRGALRR